MPISMLIGVTFYPVFSELSFITPFLIFAMLLLSYTNISVRAIQFTKMHIYLLAIQIVCSILVYFLLSSWVDPVIAQGAMICILAPTATSAVVITGMLGGNTTSLTAYSLLSNLSIALVAPILFTLVGNSNDMSFIDELWQITQRVFVLLLLPFLISILLDQFAPKIHRAILKKQSASFYLWNIALIIVTASTVNFLQKEGRAHFTMACIIFFLALIICVSQFLVGRKIGKHFNDTVAGGQGLGQKNTILAIWMAQTYLNPISSIGPGAYILWQNIINSYQVWRKHH